MLVTPDQISLERAADLLDISVPYVLRLLRDGEFARLTEEDVLSYKRRDDARQSAAADLLARDGQELDMGY